MSSQLARIVYGTRAVVNIVGILGNIVSFIIFSRAVFAKNSINIYCRALALSYCFTLNQLYVDINLSLFDIYPASQSDAFCKTFFYISVVGSAIPAWIIVFFSLDKMLSMKKSPRFDFIKKRSFQIGLIIGIVVFHLLIYLEIPILIHLVPHKTRNNLSCETSSIPYDNIVGLLYLFEASLIPFAFMFGSSMSIVKMIGRSRRKSIVGREAVKKRKSRDLKFAITSLTFNVLFIILRLPLVIFYVLTGTGIEVVDDYFQIATLLFYINSSICFVVYYVSNSLFRKEFLMFFPWNNRVDPGSQQTTIITVRPRASIDN